jgi:histidine triad (HIT) family protein
MGHQKAQPIAKNAIGEHVRERKPKTQLVKLPPSRPRTKKEESTMSTIFDKIIAGTVPCNKVFENERIIAFHDIAPRAPIHLLIVPKKPIANLANAADEDAAVLGECLIVARNLAKQLGIANNFRVITNSGQQAGQEVFHIHFHLLGGRPLGSLG